METEEIFADLQCMQLYDVSGNYKNIKGELTSTYYRECAISTGEETSYMSVNECRPVEEVSLVTELLKLNESCQEYIRKQEEGISSLLDACRKEQVRIRERIKICADESELDSRRSNYCRIFGIPYFKDTTFFPCPPNKDHLEKQTLGYFDVVDLPTVRLWKDKDKRILEEAIRKFEVCKLSNEINIQQQKLQVEVVKCTDCAQKVELESRLNDIQYRILATRRRTLEDLVGLRKDEYDWLKISTIDLKGIHTADECRAIWFNYLHPEINRKRWTQFEDDKLKEIAQKCGYQEWNKIAKELGTNRSGYQCLCHFQTRLNDHMKRSKWSSEETESLKKLVYRFQVANYIPWAKVTYYMDGRTKAQVYCHWCYVCNPDIKKGKFTREEDVLIVAGVRYFGMDFSRIAQYFACRTSVQLRQRFYTIVQAQERPSRWTMLDDRLILNLIDKYGVGNWKQICQSFPNRTSTQVRFRYQVIEKWMEKNPNSPVPIVNSRQFRNNRSVNDMWEDAQKVVTGSNIPHAVKNGEVEINEKMLNELSNVYLHGLKKKVGRKVGQTKSLSTLDEQYNSFFRCGYIQQGGRAKIVCSSEKVPELSTRMSHMLTVLSDTLDLPTDVEVIDNDGLLMPVDKSVLNFLIGKRTTQSKYKGEFIDHSKLPSSSSGSSMIVNIIVDQGQYLRSPLSCVKDQSVFKCSVIEEKSACNVSHYCPPNFSALVGLRTFLLSRRSLKKSAKSANEDEVAMLFSVTDDEPNEHNWEVRQAVQLWNERLTSLFTWPAIMSNWSPEMPKYSQPESAEKTSDFEAVFHPSPRKRGRKAKKRKVDTNPIKKEKRKYTKSGLYRKAREAVPIRKSSRRIDI